MSIEDTLSKRTEVYGDYEGGTLLRAEIMNLILERHNNATGKCMQMEPFTMILDIVNKLSRIAVTPEHIDSWHDIAGYATLVEKMLAKRRLENANK